MATLRYLYLVFLNLAVIGAEDTCHGNNCERAFNGNAVTAAAQSYCSKFTRGITSSPTDVPPYATAACSSSMASQISSICSCAYPAAPVTLMTSSSSTSVTSSSVSSSISSSSFISSSSSTTTSSVSSPVFSPRSTSTFQTSTATVAALAPGCNADNCLRAFQGGNGQSFCSAFTTGGVTTLPPYATQCTGSTLARVSSACTCLNYNPLLLSSFSSSSSSTTAAMSTTSASAAMSPAEGCNADNCLRALIREGGADGPSFCATFTTTVITATTSLPTYATQCTGNMVSRLSSACTCLPSAS